MGKGDNEKIVEAVKKISNANVAEIIEGKATSVDEENNTIDVDDDGVAYPNVSLRAVSDGTKGVVLFPKKNTSVIIGRVELGNNYVVLVVSEVDKIKIDCEEVVYNGGDNGGFAIVKDLVKKFNAIENDLNKLKQALTVWIPVPSDGGAALKTAITTYATETFIPTKVADIENKKIKH